MLTGVRKLNGKNQANKSNQDFFLKKNNQQLKVITQIIRIKKYMKKSKDLKKKLKIVVYNSTIYKEKMLPFTQRQI